MSLTPLDRVLLAAYDRARNRPKLRRVLLYAMRWLHAVRAALGGYDLRRYQGRLALSFALSLALHAFILSLQFGSAGWGLPALALPWAERRAHSWDLTVRLAARPPAAAPAAAEIEPERMPPAVSPRAKPVQPPPIETRKSAPVFVPRPAAPKAVRAARKRGPEVPVRPEPRPEIIAQADPQQETFVVPPAPVETKPPAPEVVARAEPEADMAAAKERERAAQKLAEAAAEEAAAREALAIEAERQAEEAARQQALALEQQRTIEEAQRQEEAKNQEEAKRQEEARAAREALALEAQRKAEEAARQQAVALERQRALELEALRQAEEAAREAARQRELEARRLEEARKQEEARKLEEARRQAEAQAAQARAQELAERQKAEALAAQAASRLSGGAIGGGGEKPAAGLAGRELAAKALEQLRTPSAARPEPPRPPAESADAPRRRSVFGGTVRDVGLRMYVDSWRWKIERNGNLNFPPAARTRAAENPVVTVAIRRDGSLEGVYINRTSGVRALDEAVRRIVELYAPYSPFPPDLARQYDVIEIRRIWIFSNAPNTLTLLEDLPGQ